MTEAEQDTMNWRAMAALSAASGVCRLDDVSESVTPSRVALNRTVCLVAHVGRRDNYCHVKSEFVIGHAKLAYLKHRFITAAVAHLELKIRHRNRAHQKCDHETRGLNERRV